jgi:glutathione S-transferase
MSGYTPETAAPAPARVHDVLALLGDLLAEHRGAYLLGDSLSALDLYWATFCNLLSPLPPELMPMPERMRPMFTATEPDLIEQLEKTGLLAHRDRIYREHLELPVVL